MLALTLVRGRSRKSIFMGKLHRGTKDSLFVQYGHNVLLKESDDHNECWVIDRSEQSETDRKKFKSELWEIIEHVLTATDYINVFLYGNFSLSEADILKEILRESGLSVFNITVSIQDNSVPDGQIILEEIEIK